ncbi:MAG TPA: AMP-binding protein [Thermoleophilaceae bacterium]|jgi:fatty-acyl-CoA synthase
MRVEERIAVDASAERVWELIDDPANYTRLVAGVTRWETQGRKERGLGARYLMRMEVGSAQVGSLIEIVEYDEGRDMAWTSVTGLDQRGRWRVRERPDGQTSVSLRLSYQAPGGLLAVVADRVSSPMVRDNLRETLERLKTEVEEEDPQMGHDSPGLVERAWAMAGRSAQSVKALYDARLITPERPDRLLGIIQALRRWGTTPAAGYAAAAVRAPEDDAIVDELGRLTFGQVHDRTNRLANALSDAGVLEGDAVGIMCRNHRGFIEATVALAKLGCNALYLNTAFAGPQLAEVVKREKPVAIVYDQEFTELLEDAGRRRKRFVAWHDSTEDLKDPTLEELIEQGHPAEPVPPETEYRATILTSGTTGTPKGASRSQPGSLLPAAALLDRIPLKAREKTLIAAPLFHTWGFTHFTYAMMLSSTIVLQRKFDPERTLAGIAQHKVQSCPMVPVMVQRIMDLPEETRRKYDTSSLSTVPLSGSALPGDLALDFMNEFGDVVYNLYGSTEVAWAAIATPQDLRAAPGTAGKPPIGTEVRIYDEKGTELPQGEVGRIFVGNDLLFEGYTGGGSKDVIDGLMSTGDMGCLDMEGRLFVTGRDDDMIVSGGENVFPQEVEDTISKMSGVGDVAVIGVDDEKFGQRLKAYVVTKGSSGPSEDQIKSKVKSDLAGYKVPREVEFLDELPRNATGKVLKKELKERHEEGESGGGDGKNGSKSKPKSKSKSSNSSKSSSSSKRKTAAKKG